MKHNTRVFFLTGLFLVIGTLLFINACEEKEVPYIDDAEEIRRYIAESDLGRHFFQMDSLITPDTFTIAGDPGAKYVVELDTVIRDLNMGITPKDQGKWFQFGALPNPPSGGWRDAEVVIEDELRMRTIRMTSVDTTITPSTTKLTRYGWIVKLGDDGNDYAGWVLYGFNGGSPFNNGALAARFDITAPNSYEVRGDTNVDTAIMRRFAYAIWPQQVFPDSSVFRTQFRYAKVNDTTAYLRIHDSVSLGLKLGLVPDYSNYLLITANQEGGIRTVAINQNSGYYEYDLHVPPDLTSRWYLMLFQEIRSGTARRVWCVPYRIWQ